MMDPRLARVIDTRLLTYTIEQAAGLLGVSRGRPYQLARDGVIPARRIGRRWLVPRKALHDWLDNAAGRPDRGRHPQDAGGTLAGVLALAGRTAGVQDVPAPSGRRRSSWRR